MHWWGRTKVAAPPSFRPKVDEMSSAETLRESLQFLRSLQLLLKCIDRTPNTAPATIQDVGVNHRRTHISVAE